MWLAPEAVRVVRLQAQFVRRCEEAKHRFRENDGNARFEEGNPENLVAIEPVILEGCWRIWAVYP